MSTVYHASVPVDLAAPSRQRLGAAQFYYGDNNSHVFTALVADTADPDAGLRAGTVSGTALRADGVTVVLEGEKGETTETVTFADGRQAQATPCSVTLPQAAFAIPGTLQISIKLVDDEDVTTVLSITGTVIRTETDTAVDPGEIIPDLATLQAAAAEALDAAAAATEAADHAVQYDAAQSLTDAQKAQARTNIGAASQDALAQVEDDIYSSEILTPFADPSKYTLTGYGGCRSYTGNSLAKYAVSAGQQLMLTIAKDWPYASNAEGVYQWQNADTVPANDDNPYLVGTPVTEAQNGTIVTVPEGATRLIVSHRTGIDTNVIKRILVKADDEIGKTNQAMRLFSFSDTFHSTLVESHGGSTNGTYAMNSMVGFKAAIKNGDRMVEGDIRITSDGVPVMFHDVAMNSTNISGWTGDPVYIGAMTYAQTQAYDLPKSSGKIPTLEEFLLLCKKANVIAELDMAGKTWKSDESTTILTQAEAFAIVLDVVDKCGMRGSVMFTGEYSGSTNQISAWMTVDTDVVIGVSNRTSASAVAAIDAIIQTYPLVVCSVGTSYTDSDLMDAIRAYGKKCKAKAFSIESLGDVDAAFDSGVDFCMSYAITQNAYNEYLLP